MNHRLTRTRPYLKALVLLFCVSASLTCVWPTADVLFIIDGTLSLDQFQFQKEISFISQSLSLMRISEDGSQIGLAQFTPKGRQEFGLGQMKTNTEVQRGLDQVGFAPCDVLSDQSHCTPRASINSLAGAALQSNNRKWLPDVVVVISSAKYRIPEKLGQETLFSPQSPLHIFYIIIGGTSPDESRFEPSATSIRLNAVDFSALQRLVQPLCETVNSFVTRGSSKIAGFGRTCWLVTGILAAVLLLSILILGYAVYAYRREGQQMDRRLKEMEKTLRTQNEFFTAKLHSQMEEQIKASEKHAEELRKHNESMQAQQLELQRQRQLSAMPPTTILQAPPFSVPYLQNPAVSQQQLPPEINTREALFGALGHRGPALATVERSQESDIRNKTTPEPSPAGKVVEASRKDDELKLRLDKLEESLVNAKKQGENGPVSTEPHASSPEQYWHNANPHAISEEDTSDVSTDDSGYVGRIGHLAPNHPARRLPPIDILFLVDSSSSIGISNFETVKSNIINVLEDVDIGPGRSRVALVQYALQPSVVFGFDKYYSLKSVQKGVERMSYTGGATMLAKALSFAAGLLYREQNMKDVKKRKHKLMPTPRHDRLQVLCLVSDGASDDNIDKATAYLHEKLQIKVLAMVTRHFNKDRLVSVTRFEGSIFVMDQKESISIWLWRQQKMWAENYSAYIEREKSMPLSVKHSPKKSSRLEETLSKSPNSV